MLVRNVFLIITLIFFGSVSLTQQDELSVDDVQAVTESVAHEPEEEKSVAVVSEVEKQTPKIVPVQAKQENAENSEEETKEQKTVTEASEIQKENPEVATMQANQEQEDKSVQDEDHNAIIAHPEIVGSKKSNVASFVSPVKSVVPQTVVNPADEDSSSVAKQSVVATSMQPVSIVKATKPIMAQSDETTAQDDVDVTNLAPISKHGLNTMRIDSGGNWLEKRVWYEHAQQLFEVIRSTIQRASDVRMKFVHEVNLVGQKIDDFYEKIGFQKGHIDELLSAITSDIATDKEIRGGDLTSDERNLRLKVRTTQTQLESISKDFQLIKTLDDQIDKTMEKAFKEIEICRSLETKAWNNFKEIGMELDDKKARVLFYEMENFHKNIEQKMQYLQTNLLQYLQEQLVSKVTQTITQITTNAQIISTQATSIQTMLQKDEKGDFVILKQRDEELAKAGLDPALQGQPKTTAAVPSEPSKKKTSLSWYETLADHAHAGYVKILELLTIIVCCAKTMLCKMQQMICSLFGN